VVDQVLVDLVGHHDQVVLAGDLGDRGQLGAREHRAGRIVRGVQQDQPGVGCDGGAQAVDVQDEPVAVRDEPGGAAPGPGEGDGGGVGVVVRLDQHDFLTGFD